MQINCNFEEMRQNFRTRAKTLILSKNRQLIHRTTFHPEKLAQLRLNLNQPAHRDLSSEIVSLSGRLSRQVSQKLPKSESQSQCGSSEPNAWDSGRLTITDPCGSGLNLGGELCSRLQFDSDLAGPKHFLPPLSINGFLSRVNGESSCNKF